MREVVSVRRYVRRAAENMTAVVVQAVVQGRTGAVIRGGNSLGCTSPSRRTSREVGARVRADVWDDEVIIKRSAHGLK